VRTKLVAVAVAVLGLVLAGCGSDHAVSLGPAPKTSSTSAADVTDTLRAPLSLEVWFVRAGRLVAASRTHVATRRVAAAALMALLGGPTASERAAGVTSAVPAGTRLLAVSIKRGVATVDLTSDYQSGGGSLSMQLRLGQVV
jgi:hypothetical protein